MADTDLPETLADLLQKGAVPAKPQRLQGRYNLGSPLNYARSGGAGGDAALSGLHGSLARELSVVDAMFQQWSQGAEISLAWLVPSRVDRARGASLALPAPLLLLPHCRSGWRQPEKEESAQLSALPVLPPSELPTLRRMCRRGCQEARRRGGP